MPFHPLETERLVLRPLVPGDAEAVHAYRSDPEVARFQSWGSTTLEDVLGMIQGGISEEPDVPGTWFQVAIVRREDGAILGDCGIHFLAEVPRSAEIGITLAAEHQRQGYATEALTAVLDYLFTGLGKHRVHGSVDPANTASARLLERVGMRKEAHFVESLWFKGRWADDLVFAILDREWKARKA